MRCSLGLAGNTRLCSDAGHLAWSGQGQSVAAQIGRWRISEQSHHWTCYYWFGYSEIALQQKRLQMMSRMFSGVH